MRYLGTLQPQGRVGEPRVGDDGREGVHFQQLLMGFSGAGQLTISRHNLLVQGHLGQGSSERGDNPMLQ